MSDLVAKDIEEARRLAHQQIRSDVCIIEAQNDTHWFFLVEGRYCGASIRKKYPKNILENTHKEGVESVRNK